MPNKFNSRTMKKLINTKSIIYKIKRNIVKYRNRIKQKSIVNSLGKLTTDELNLYNKIAYISKENKKDIRFDPVSNEILITLPNMLIILNNKKVSIYNTTGFLNMELPDDTYNILVGIIQYEAHRERRRLKFETKKRINNFLDELKLH